MGTWERGLHSPGGGVMLPLFGLAVLGLGALALGASSASPSEASWVARVLAVVSGSEGGYSSVNPNTDGAGLSFGLLQWTQASGNLGKLLGAMQQDDAPAFARGFGTPHAELLRQTRSTDQTVRLAPVGGVLLWREPWLSRFRSAGAHPTFRLTQDRLALEGEHMRAALELAWGLGGPTERSVALLFDTAVQQGPNAAKRIASQVVQALQAEGYTTVSSAELLSRYAAQAAAPYRRRSPPESSRYTWKRASDGSYHAWVGSVDLYADITRRRQAILTHPELGDTLLA